MLPQVLPVAWSHQGVQTGGGAAGWQGASGGGVGSGSVAAPSGGIAAPGGGIAAPGGTLGALASPASASPASASPASASRFPTARRYGTAIGSTGTGAGSHSADCTVSPYKDLRRCDFTGQSLYLANFEHGVADQLALVRADLTYAKLDYPNPNPNPNPNPRCERT